MWPKQFLYALASGTLMGIGVFVPFLWPSVFVGVALLIGNSFTAHSFRQSYFLSFAASAVFFGMSLYPFFWAAVLPSNIEPFGSVLTFLAWVSAVLASSVAAALFGIFAKYTFQKKWTDYAVLPSAFVVFFSAASFAVDIINIGTPIRIGGNTTVGSPAYLLANDPVLLQLSAIGGMYGLLFAIGVISFSLYTFVTQPQARKKIIALALASAALWSLIFFALKTFESKESKTAHISVTAFSLKLPQRTDQSEDSYSRRHALISALIRDSAPSSLIVFPENAGFFEYVGARDPNVTAVINNAELVIDSAYVREDVVPKNRIRYYQPRLGNDLFSYKWLFVPFGEYVPYWLSATIKLPFFASIRDGFYENKVFVAGAPNAEKSSLGKVAALLCVEAVSPNLYREQVKNGAQILANLASLSSFAGNQTTVNAMKRIYKTRAAETRRYMVVSSDSSPAYIISPYGEVIAQKTGYTSLQGFIRARSDITPYTRFGNLVLIPFVLLICIGICVQTRNRLRTTHN